MIELLDRQQSLTINQWKIFTAVILSIMLDFFDFLLIGFVLAFFVQDWHLTYGQSALILFSSGIAAVPGAIFFGWLGDRVGRRKVFMITVLTFSLATGAMALTPDRTWVAPTRGNRSVKAQWVVARRPLSNPATPKMKAPVQTDVTYFAAPARRRTNSMVSRSPIAWTTP